MDVDQGSNEPIRKDLERMASLFGEMLHKNALLRSECVEEVFDKLIIECERQKEKLLFTTPKLDKHEANLHEANLLKRK